MNKNLVIAIISLVAAVVVFALIFFDVFKFGDLLTKPTPTPTPIQEPSLGEELYKNPGAEVPDNPFEQANPLSNTKTNPFKDTVKNPFE